MSILQDYEEINRLIGKKKVEAISVYIEEQNNSLLFSDVVYKKKEWEKFEKWYKEVYNNRHGKGARRNKAF